MFEFQCPDRIYHSERSHSGSPAAKVLMHIVIILHFFICVISQIRNSYTLLMTLVKLIHAIIMSQLNVLLHQQKVDFKCGKVLTTTERIDHISPAL